MQVYSYEFYQESADYLLAHLPQKPELALILGSSLGSLADELEQPLVIEYQKIPNFLVSTVQSHASKFIFGYLGGKYVAVMSGRFHYYEGYSFEQLAAPIRVLQLIGVKATILTNAAGAANPAYSVGDIMVIRDQIKFFESSPMRGENLPQFGRRFFDVSDMYTQALRALALDCAARLGQSAFMREGCYFYFPGPQFETPAEIRACRLLGGDAVGMSTVTEALTAAHCGMKLLGLSLITNMAAGVLNQPIDGAEVDVAAAEASQRFKDLLREIVQAM